MAGIDEGIIFELMTRDLNQYHRLTKFPVRIGRALDNDIIISDVMISSYHLEIDRNAKGELVLRNLSDENGSKVGRQPLKGKPMTIDLTDKPVWMSLGSRRARLLRPDMKVEKTRVRPCSGLYILFCKPIYSLALMLIAMFAFVFENYLKTMYEKEISYYLSDLFPYLLVMIALTLLVAGISRLSIQRWEVGAALSLVTLAILGPHLAGELGHLLNYFFTADWPTNGLIVFSNFLLLPLLFYGYIRLVHQSEVKSAMCVALLFSTPVMLFQASDFADRMVISNEFTGEAEFSRELSSFDLRLAPTLSIDEFIEDIVIDMNVDEKTLQSKVNDTSTVHE